MNGFALALLLPVAAVATTMAASAQLPAAPESSSAEAVQANGVITISSSQPTLINGGTLQETIRITNASTSTGGLGNVDVSAVLEGVTDVTLACVDPHCQTPVPGTLVFTGCEILTPEVCGCDLDPSDPSDNTVKITMCSGGISLTPSGGVDLVTISVMINDSDPAFFTRAATGSTDLRAWSSATPTIYARGGAQGSLLLPGGVETSGRIIVTSTQLVLTEASPLQETIAITNASTDNESIGNSGVPATLGGVTVVKLACVDAACTVPLAGTLAFTSCTNWAPGVCACDLDPSDTTDNTVKITMCAGGVALPAGGSMDLVTINAIAISSISATSSPVFFTGAATGLSDIEACSSTAPSLCSADGAQGSLSLSFPAPTQSLASGFSSRRRLHRQRPSRYERVRGGQRLPRQAARG